MKMLPEHQEHIRRALAHAFVPQQYRAHRDRIQAEGKAKDIDMRARWDALYACGLSSWISSTLYPYLNDAHIDTALRAIVRELFEA